MRRYHGDVITLLCENKLPRGEAGTPRKMGWLGITGYNAEQLQDRQVGS